MNKICLGVSSKMLGLSGSQQTNSNGALNLGASMGGSPMQMQMQNPWATQQPMMQGSSGAFMNGITGGQANQWGQQPIAPPSDMELQIMLLRSIVPIDRFIASNQMGLMIDMLSSLISFSVLEILRNATFNIDEDNGTMTLDVSKLPQHLQTVSGENVKSHFSSLQSTAQQNINAAEQNQQQLAYFAQQSMMGGMLQSALADEGMMQKVGGGVGSFARSIITGGR